MGLKVLLGHAYLGAAMREGSALSYDEEEKTVQAAAALDVLSAGSGLHDDFRYNGNYLVNSPVNGQGWGLDLGMVFHSNSHAVSFDVRDIGMILWNGREVRRGTLVMRKEFDLSDFALGMEGMFDFDTLVRDTANYAMWLPAELNAGYTYTLRFGGNLGIILGGVSAGACYSRRLVAGYGEGVPLRPERFSGGVTLGLLSGHLPLRYGVAYGGPEGVASVAGVGLDAKYVSIDAFYKAVGSLTMRSKKGFEAGVGMAFRWGWNRGRNYVKDGSAKTEEEQTWILDSIPEPALPALGDFKTEIDGEEVYEPIEVITQPPQLPQPPPEMPQPEPPQPEPPQPEQPEAPTPEPQPEQPPLMPEQPQLTAEEAESLAVAQSAINFTPGSASLTESSYAPLDRIAGLLKRYPHIRYEVQGHTDSWGAEAHNLLLSAERAAVVKHYLMTKGAPDSCLVSIGYGRNMPIADNNTVVGRALNRRVVFVRIDSQEQYDTLKRFEMEMMRRLTERVLEKREWRKTIR